MIKKYSIYLGTILGSLIAIPAGVIFIGGYYNNSLVYNINEPVANAQDTNIILEQQIIGILAREVPYTSHEEVLKLNSVIIRTYLLKRQQSFTYELLPLTTDEMRELWQDDYEKIYSIYKEAVDATDGEVLYHEGELIEPIYHQASSGATRDAKEVYDIDVPYLLSVGSEVDEVENTIKYSIDELITILSHRYPNIYLDKDYIAHQIQIIERGESGYIKRIQFGNMIVNETDFKDIFNLPSTNVQIEISNDSITFTTMGVGDGVGLSQNGANKYAEQGITYTEILEYYYTGVQVEKYMN